MGAGEERHEREDPRSPAIVSGFGGRCECEGETEIGAGKERGEKQEEVVNVRFIHQQI